MARTSHLSQEDLAFIRSSKLKAQVLADRFQLSRSHIHYLRRKPPVPAHARPLSGEEILTLIQDPRKPHELAPIYQVSVARIVAFRRAYQTP